MELKKGDIIKETKKNDTPYGKDCLTANCELFWEVERVNPKTYTIRCVKGYIKGSSCKICKGFQDHCSDMYGTETTWEIVGDFKN